MMKGRVGETGPDKRREKQGEVTKARIGKNLGNTEEQICGRNVYYIEQ